MTLTSWNISANNYVIHPLQTTSNAGAVIVGYLLAIKRKNRLRAAVVELPPHGCCYFSLPHASFKKTYHSIHFG